MRAYHHSNGLHQEMQGAAMTSSYFLLFGRCVKAETSLRKLTHGYPSHDFLIDREEAETLFVCVRPPSEDETALAEALKGVIAADMGRESAAIRKIDIGEGDKHDDASGKSEGPS